MNKVIIIGCPGGGKSTFARKLQKITGLPLYHMDLLFWNSDKTHISRELLSEKLNKILYTEKWIIDGNYGGTMEMRLKECDTIFFLDYPIEVCLDSIRSRKGSSRPDMPWLSDEDDDEFLEFIRNFNKDSRPNIIQLLQKYSGKNVYVFRERNEADSFLENIQNSSY